MSLDAAGLYALLPAVYRTRDAAAGGQLQALCAVLAEQSGIVSATVLPRCADAGTRFNCASRLFRLT